ncbi:NAD(P)-dependent alcohol dehydrogenase [Providencia hangzhouensis]|uniref:NAD(P)-dependent alcohol dehydrogenase n=1 Tax=Providencia rettgeri TaxID=587 RepID=A0AAE2ZFL7_PRORE|nr:MULTISPECIES: NAD(P)-dependent alcohol dehydrogenase [Providencia]MRF68195.1 alcohol dehydrogenase catalytic domain-containing protein [Escherichia coli]MBW3117065.1 NAD(P)-dependent alcohol dehydrogenase [Providencia rettgeri]MCG9527736.1 NAD(P)-dependent alcohol dehydrogenase [Providencia rettgeri]MCK9790620.1 NAD(P)-dependent alcohol dehydrogenase [Providencia rettgeri]MDX7425560.1 NAD(P)-dependent alcohol dehydrogenase [Providencia sp. CIM-Carb-044]
MSIKILGYAAKSNKSPLAPFVFERRDLREDDVLIDIEYCGVCHTDIHQSRNDWGVSQYPIVPGHEIVGRISNIGNKVSKFKVGDIVGIGFIVDSCQDCTYCKSDLEQYCEEGPTQTFNSLDRYDGRMTYGGYSKKIVCSENFVVKVPKNLDLKAVPPILCAGITTWSPLRHWKVGNGTKLAIVGLGGLGHMAIKLAHALGAEITLITSSKSKIADAIRLGAHHVVLSTDEAKMAEIKNQFDIIIDTIPYEHDLKPYVSTLTLDGTLVLVGYIGEFNTSSVPLYLGRKSISASLIGGIKETQELLDFCGEHNIVAEIELINIENINQAYERMLKRDVKYRFVIDNSSF